jgi:nucleoside-diphosphate-sugar epimerase
MPRTRSSPPADALVTGASGFLGAHLVAELLRRPGRRVYVLSRHPTPVRSPRVVVLAADVGRSLDGLPLPPRIGTVYHCASPPGQSTDVRALRDANVRGTRHLLAYAARARARRLVYVSSGGVCRRGAGAIREDSPLAPDTPYLEAKAAGERELVRAGGTVPTAVVRLFFPYGPGQRVGLVPRLCARLLAREPILVGAAGTPRLNPIHVRDAARLVRRIGTGPAEAVVVNVAGREVVSVARLARILAGHLGVRPVFEADGAPRPSLVGDLRRMRRFGVPRLGLAAGLHGFVETWAP